MAAYTTELIHPKYHDAIVGWQKKNFPEMGLLEKNWEKYFPGQTPFALLAKIGNLKSEFVEVGAYAGQKRFEKAGEMTGNMFYSARDIIKAQCSTELGSIQQHRMSLENAIGDDQKYCVLRIMAEELRHAYQCFWMLDHDSTWKRLGGGDVTEETIEMLLQMETGGHVLDAFNIEFNDFLDNAMFAMVIDLVGKYQLEMQKAFSYAPVARSMGPMFSEEGFHIGTGRRLVKEIAVRGAKGEGNWSVADVQKAMNEWYPRGLEMFGNEAGGETAVYFGFKDRTNGQAQGQYIEEVKGVIDDVNSALVQLRNPGMNGLEAKKVSREVCTTREPRANVKYEDLVHQPSNKFFRGRGLPEFALQPFDVDGNLLTEGGKPYTAEQYVGYLTKILPDRYVKSREFEKYKKALYTHHAAAGQHGLW